MNCRHHHILLVSALEYTHSALKISKSHSWWQGLLQRSWDPAWHLLKHSLSRGLRCVRQSPQVLGRMLQRVNRQRWNVLTDHLMKVGLGSPNSAFWLSNIFLLSPTCFSALASSSLPLIDFSWALCRGWLMSKTWAQLFTTETCVYFTEGCFLCFWESGRASFYPWQCLFRRWKVISRKQSGDITFFSPLLSEVYATWLWESLSVFCI